MSEFNLVQIPPRGPTKCFFCGDFEGPFIDTFVDVPGHGAVYICAPNENRPGCLGNMANLVGYHDKYSHQSLLEANHELKAQVNELQAEINAYERMKDLQTFLRERASKKRGPVVEAAHVDAA